MTTEAQQPAKPALTTVMAALQEQLAAPQPAQLAPEQIEEAPLLALAVLDTTTPASQTAPLAAINAAPAPQVLQTA